MTITSCRLVIIGLYFDKKFKIKIAKHETSHFDPRNNRFDE